VGTVFEAVGGLEGLVRLAGAWHARVMADEVVSHAFSHGYHPDHTARLAAYWAEALGGPTTYSESYGDETSVVRVHSGNGEHEEMDRRAIDCFDNALADAGLAEDARLRRVLHDYFAWSTTTPMARYHRSADEVPDGLPIPRWSWEGLVRDGADLRRATTLPELQAKMDLLVSDAGFAAGLAFVPRPSDVIIASYAKCGTTWLQQMVHSLRTGGDLDFDDISRVVPWIETAADLGIDLDAPQRGEPRVFKSHLSYDQVPPGARYIVSVRDPRDALVSAYRFFEGWFFEPGSIDIEDLGRARFVEGRAYYRHLVSWWPHRRDENVLLLAYEHMKEDGEATVRRVAEFIGVGDDEQRIIAASRESSFAQMDAHKNRYDDLLMRERSEQVCGLPPGSDSSKVRAGRTGAHRLELSPRLVADLDVAWRETVTPEIGFATYEALLEELATDT